MTLTRRYKNHACGTSSSPSLTREQGRMFQYGIDAGVPGSIRSGGLEGQSSGDFQNT